MPKKVALVNNFVMILGAVHNACTFKNGNNSSMNLDIVVAFTLALAGLHVFHFTTSWDITFAPLLPTHSSNTGHKPCNACKEEKSQMQKEVRHCCISLCRTAV